jgi:hypothetical protein
MEQDQLRPVSMIVARVMIIRTKKVNMVIMVIRVIMVCG